MTEAKTRVTVNGLCVFCEHDMALHDIDEPGCREMCCVSGCDCGRPGPTDQQQPDPSGAVSHEELAEYYQNALHQLTVLEKENKHLQRMYEAATAERDADRREIRRLAQQIVAITELWGEG